MNTERGHGKNPGYFAGENNAICDVCGFVYRSSKLRKRWDNLFVCGDDWEPRQPQDMVRGRADDMRAKITRPDTDPVYLSTPITRDGL